MKTLALLLALFFFSITLHAQDQEKLLEHAYKTKSKKELKKFFDNWHKEIPPISDSEFARLSDLQKETYKVFEAFYHPEIIKNWDGSYYDDSILPKTKYCIMQNTIYLYQCNYIAISPSDSDSIVVMKITKDCTDSEKVLMIKQLNNTTYKKLEKYIDAEHEQDEKYQIDSIWNFRPQINFAQKRTVYANSLYDSLLYFFEAPADPSMGGIAEFRIRQEFLLRFAKTSIFSLGLHQSKPVFIPYIEGIIFDRTHKRALVDFNLGEFFGQGVLQKSNGKWTLIASYLTGAF